MRAKKECGACKNETTLFNVMTVSFFIVFDVFSPFSVFGAFFIVVVSSHGISSDANIIYDRIIPLLLKQREKKKVCSLNEKMLDASCWTIKWFEWLYCIVSFIGIVGMVAFFVHGNVITLCFTVALPFPRVRMVFRGHFRSELPYRKRWF